MAYLEKRRFIHRDLAARNCLLDNKEQVKISDFGLSLVTSGVGVHKEKTPMILPIKWLAPEILTKWHFFQYLLLIFPIIIIGFVFRALYSHKSDVWAFGVLCWEVYNKGTEPYPG